MSATPNTPPSSEDLLLDFLTAVEARGLSLYPAQEQAVLELLDGKNVILNTPTGSGKSLVASMLHRQALALGRRSVYTCPIKALVNEKWMALCKEFGPENVGLSTGDATVNHDALILCCTAEILSNIALCEGAESTIRDVVMDEFHYYSDRERGVAWQVPLLAMPHARFLLMSATLGETAFFEEVMTKLNGLPSVTVRSRERPVPLDFSWSESPLANAVQKIVNEGKAPVYVVHFTQADAATNAQNFTSLDLCTKEEKAALAAAIAGFRFSSPYGPDLKRWLRQGIGLHHAGLLPKYRILMEKLAQKGLLKVICGTDTLGVGVNVPIRTVLFTQLCKYSGDKTAILTARDFHQIAGRAGRKGYDNVGYVVAQAPEHVVENIKLAAKAAASGKKNFSRKQPPERGYVPWDENTYRKLIDALPEKLVSRFAVSHGMLLNVLSRSTDGCVVMRGLIRDCHDTNKQKGEHKKRAFQLFRSLVERDIIGFVPPSGPGMAKVKVHADLGEDFTMHQQLSLWLLDTIPLLNAEDSDYHLDLLTLVESILENPDVILRRQLDAVKTAAMAEMKAQGLEYDERIAKLEELEYPKPLREFVYHTFNEFSDKHPWVGNENIRPKSIVREMFEEFLTFSGYIKRYGLERSEGLLLRHLNGVYKVLAHTVPDGYKNDAVWEIENYLGEMLHRVDSSLLEEWERLRNPDFVAEFSEEPAMPGAAAAAADITRDAKKFTAAIRARIFEFLSALWRRNVSDALDCLCEDLPEGATPVDGAGERWSERRLVEQLALYTAEHGAFRMDAEGRALRHTVVDTHDAGVWRILQMLQDHNDLNDWCVEFTVDLTASREAEAPMLRLEGIREAV
jgi:superfamily II RNA helicase